jgi:hypothetical protein
MEPTRAVRALLLSIAMGLVAALAGPAMAQEKPWKDGTVWNVTFVKTKAGMGDIYLRDLAANWKRLMDAAQKEGLIVSYRILGGSAANRDDWDLMLLTEAKNWASFDNATAKWDALSAKVIGPEDKQQQMVIKRVDVREIVGEKVMQEIIFK